MSGSVIRKSSRTALKESRVLLSFINLGRALKSRGPILANEWYLRVLAYMLFDLSCGTLHIARINCLKGLTYWERLKELKLMSIQIRGERYIILRKYSPTLHRMISVL